MTADLNPAPSAAQMMDAGAFGWGLSGPPTGTVDDPSLSANPNILMLMVDQMRIPQYWLTGPGPGTQQAALDLICPNIAWLRNTSYRFWNFYVAAQDCSPSPSTLLTGFYTHQTGMFSTATSGGVPLETDFPTFGNALQTVAGYVPNNVLWFGKWHLSNLSGGANSGGASSDTLPGFGFNYGRSITSQGNGQINWPSYYGSPNGAPNEGTNGYLSPVLANVPQYACDQAIAQDFVNNWTNYPPTAGKPWFACVSFVNPHDINFYPGFFPPDSNNDLNLRYPGEPANPGSQGVFTDPNEPGHYAFAPHYSGYPTSSPFPIFPPGTLPTSWNWETTLQLQAKSYAANGASQDGPNFLQYYFQNDRDDANANFPSTAPNTTAPPLQEADFTDFLNWYYYFMSLVDSQIGTVLTTVLGSGFNNTVYTNPSSNTNIIFLSDHGDHGGSHGLHSKGGAVYDEVLRVPFYVVTPGQSGSFDRVQMTSTVDVFRLVVELALGSIYTWSADPYGFADQAQNESIFAYIKYNESENIRVYTDSGGTVHPFVLTTTDEIYVDQRTWVTEPNINVDCSLRNHVVCLRTRSEVDTTNLPVAYTGAKLSIYSKWLLKPSADGYTYARPIEDFTSSAGAITQDWEYYDYLNYNNRSELGNDYPNALTGSGVNGPAAQALLTSMKNVLGNMANVSVLGGTLTPATGVILSLLQRPLSATYNGNALSAVTAAGIANWYTTDNIPILSGSCTT